MKRFCHKTRPCGGIVLFAIIGLSLALVGGWLWIKFRPQPAPRQEMLFQGVEYIRDVRSSPKLDP